MSTTTIDTKSPLYSDIGMFHEELFIQNIHENFPWTTNLHQEEHSENVTILHDRPSELEETFIHLFTSAKDELFEDGMENEFSKALTSLIKKYENDALAELAYFIVYEKSNPEVIAEALRCLSTLDDSKTYIFRRWLLERSLQSSSLWIRDGAALGLSYMDDPHAISFLKAAITTETIDEIRGSFQQVLDQLESTERCQRF